MLGGIALSNSDNLHVQQVHATDIRQVYITKNSPKLNVSKLAIDCVSVFACMQQSTSIVTSPC